MFGIGRLPFSEVTMLARGSQLFPNAQNQILQLVANNFFFQYLDNAYFPQMQWPFNLIVSHFVLFFPFLSTESAASFFRRPPNSLPWVSSHFELNWMNIEQEMNKQRLHPQVVKW